MKDLKCSITVEASLIMITVILTLGTLITVSMSLYDKVLSRCVLLETMELYSHRYEDQDYLANEARLENCMLSENGKIVIEEDQMTGITTGKVNTGSYFFEKKITGIKPEKIMRAVTLTKLLEEKSDENIY